MTMSENQVVMALSQKVAVLEQRLETVAKLYLGLAEKYEAMGKDLMMQEANLRDVADRFETYESFQNA